MTLKYSPPPARVAGATLTQIERLLNYKRYIDWRVEQELSRINKQQKERK